MSIRPIVPDDRLKHVAGMPKVDRYKWTVHDEPGTLALLPKSALRIDDSYQRTAADGKVQRIASAWSWIACGCIVVAQRSDGTYCVMDGQHRVLAANKRTDIQTLPCIVFRSTSLSQEAGGFLRGNTERKAVTSYEKFRALCVVNDPTAIGVRDTIALTGHSFSDGSNCGKFKLTCVTCLLAEYERAPDTFKALWPIIAQVCDRSSGGARSDFIRGLFYVERHMPEGQSVTSDRWRSRLISVGPDEIARRIRANEMMIGHGGEAVWGGGILAALNFRLKTPLELRP